MSPIRFYLSSALDSAVDDIDNAVFSVNGQPIYQTGTPLSVSQRITTLKRLQSISPSLVKGDEASGTEAPPHVNYSKAVEAAGGSGVKVGEIEYHQFSPTIFRYEGQTVDEHHMFLKPSLLNAILVGDRKFKAPDGHTYVWSKTIEGMELSMKHEHDKKLDIVATWTPRRHGIVHSEPLPPCLEILPEAQHMMDLVFLTFVFVHYENHK